MRLTTCTSCAARIFFARKLGGEKPIPFDATPTPEGTWVQDRDPATREKVMRPFDPMFDGEVDTYRPHWATCPNANKHRGDR